MKPNHEEILAARNRTKRRCNIFYYEAMGNIARAHGFTASQFFFGCAAMAMQAMRKDMDFLNDSDKLILKNLRVCISSCK